MNTLSKTFTRISQAASQSLQQMRQATTLVPGMRGKPAIVRHWLFHARWAQAFLLLFLLVMPTLIPEYVDAVVESFFDPSAVEKVTRFFKGLQTEPGLETYQVTIRAVLWIGSVTVVLFLLAVSLPTEVARAQGISEDYEQQADALMASDPAQSVLLYESALALTLVPENEKHIQGKLAQAETQVRLPNGALMETTQVATRSDLEKNQVVEPAASATGMQTIANRYDIQREVGRGAMGLVYMAQDRLLERVVALKQLAPQLARDAQFVERFQREAKALAKLSHPNIVQIYDYLEAEGAIWIAMEWVEGAELADRLAGQQPLPLAECLDLGLQMSRALAYAHTQGVVHRDFKPANVLLTRDGSVKVMDFGLAKVAQSSAMTQVGTVMGSPAYMSPEQAAGKDCDSRADIYALGIVLYAMATGELPFKGDAQAVLAQHLSQTPAAPQSVNPAIPVGLNELILQMLAKSPEERPPAMERISETLAALAAAAPTA